MEEGKWEEEEEEDEKQEEKEEKQLPCFPLPPAWSVGSAHIASALRRPVLTQGSFMATGFVASRALFSGGVVWCRSY